MLRSSVVTPFWWLPNPENEFLWWRVSVWGREKSQGVRLGELVGCSKIVMLFSGKNYWMVEALWAGALWWRGYEVLSQKPPFFTNRSKQEPQDLVHTLNSQFGHVTRNDVHVNDVFDINKAISRSFILDIVCLAFFGLGDSRLFYSRLWRLASGSYSKIQDSSPVMMFSNKCGSIFRCLKMSWDTCMRLQSLHPWNNLRGDLSILQWWFSKRSLGWFGAHLRSFAQSADDRYAPFASRAHVYVIRWRLSTSRCAFHLFKFLSESSEPLENTTAGHRLISGNMLKHFQCF